MSLFVRLLLEYLRGHFSVSDWQLGHLEAHFLLLQKWNKKINLTRIEEIEEIVVRHYCEAVALADMLPFGKLRIIDAGSGAGFPGIPLAIMRPDCFVLLVESDGRKSVFLREAVLNITNCLVIRDRLENVGQEADWIVGRAIRWQEIVEASDRLSDHVALMLSVDQVSGVLNGDSKLDWGEAKPLPWGRNRVILLGHRKHVSRGTSVG
jgi:16S rRNA (guanine(527)-N(7))-methyltransferase RsmG